MNHCLMYVRTRVAITFFAAAVVFFAPYLLSVTHRFSVVYHMWNDEEKLMFVLANMAGNLLKQQQKNQSKNYLLNYSSTCYVVVDDGHMVMIITITIIIIIIIFSCAVFFLLLLVLKAAPCPALWVVCAECL